MERTKSGFYVIDALALKQPAKKPFHLEDRLRSKDVAAADSFHTNPLDLLPSEGAADAVASHTLRGALRHAAFIEARRSKLSKHTERISKVHAEHKRRLDSESESRRAQLDETMMAAERNRNAIIDAAVQHARETVERAKEVARSQSEKMQHESMVRRREIERRLNMSERRRNKLNLIPRSRWLELQYSSEMDIESARAEAATTIQQRWRKFKLEKLVTQFVTFGISVQRLSDVPFEELVSRVQSDKVIKVTAKLLARLRKMVSHPQKNSEKWNNPARVYLSSYLMFTHPEQVMPEQTELEKTLAKHAESTVQDFETWIDTYSSENGFTNACTFYQSFNAFYNVFMQWKDIDTQKIVTGMVSHYMELERLWLSVMHQVDAEAQWRPRIEAQQTQIVRRLKHFGRSAIVQLDEERRKLRAEIGVEGDDEDDEPAMTSSSESEGERSGRISTSASDVEGPAAPIGTSPQMYPTPRSAARKGSRDSVTMRARDTSSSPERTLGTSPLRGMSPLRRGPPPPTTSPPMPMESSPPPAQSPRVAPATLPTGSNASSSSAPQSTATTDVRKFLSGYDVENLGVLTNEELAHELIMDPGFTLEKPTRTALEERVRVIATRAFWDVVREEFAKSKFDNMVPGVLNDIRQQLLSIVSESGKIAQEIRAKLDIPFLVQQLEHKILNIRSTYLYITDKMSQLCAPVRDASIRELHNTLASDSTSIDYALISQRILDILEDMKLDLSNYRLQTLRPHLAEIAVAYEKSKFAEAREKGVVGIERTKEWISASVETLKGTLAQRNPENIELSDRVRYEVAYHEAVLSLVLPAGVVEEVTKENVPETMILDVERIKKYRAEGVKLATIAAVVTLARNSSAVMRDPLRTRGLRDTLIVLLEDSESSPSHISAAVVDAIEKAGGKVAEPELLKGMVERCVRGDSVFAVVMRRVAGVVRGHLATGVFRGGERELARVGLEMVGRELEALSLRVFTLAKHNARVHAELYDEILSDLV